MIRHLGTLLLSPLLLIQALRTRRRVPRLPEAAGPRSGIRGTGPLLRLLITGDSAVAGVGASSQDEALAGQLLKQLAEACEVHWKLEARSGATTASAIAHLEELAPQPFDLVVTGLGVNDVTGLVRLDTWLKRQHALRELLRQRFGARRILVSGLPPMHAFPGLPQPLRWYLGSRARRFDQAIADAIRGEADCRFVSLQKAGEAADMASDGFHPGPAVYAEWARRLADVIMERPCEPEVALTRP